MVTMKHFSSNRKGQVFGLDGLQGFVLLIVLVGMLIGIGVLMMDKFGAVTYYTILDHNQTVATASIDNASHVDFDYGNISSLAIWNQTKDVFPAICYQVNATATGKYSFQLTNTTAPTDEPSCEILGVINLIYDSKEYDTATRDATFSIGSEISGIATNWMGLIVTVAVLAIILGLVLIAFRPGMDRG